MKKNLFTKFIVIIFLITSFPNISSTIANAGWFDKKIKVKKCYRPNQKRADGKLWFKNYKGMKTRCNYLSNGIEHTGGNCSPFVEVDIQAEIDLEEKLIVIESVVEDKVSISRHPILSATDSYIATEPSAAYGEWVFDLKKETMSGTNGKVSKVGIRCMGGCLYKCDFN